MKRPFRPFWCATGACLATALGFGLHFAGVIPEQPPWVWLPGVCVWLGVGPCVPMLWFAGATTCAGCGGFRDPMGGGRCRRCDG